MVYDPTKPQDSVQRVVRISPIATNKAIAGKAVVITGIRGATAFDSARVVVRLLNADGSLGDEYLVLPGIIVEMP